MPKKTLAEGREFYPARKKQINYKKEFAKKARPEPDAEPLDSEPLYQIDLEYTPAMASVDDFHSKIAKEPEKWQIKVNQRIAQAKKLL